MASVYPSPCSPQCACGGHPHAFDELVLHRRTRGRAHFYALGSDRGSVVCGLVYWGKRTAARLKAVGWAAEA
eukprot:scaffold41699_cov50-Phaeocystis_antarctica.AAC.1